MSSPTFQLSTDGVTFLAAGVALAGANGLALGAPGTIIYARLVSTAGVGDVVWSIKSTSDSAPAYTVVKEPDKSCQLTIDASSAATYLLTAQVGTQSASLAIKVKTSAGFELLAAGESNECDPINGWCASYNALARGAGGGGGGSLPGNLSDSVLGNNGSAYSNSRTPLVRGIQMRRIVGPSAEPTDNGSNTALSTYVDLNYGVTLYVDASTGFRVATTAGFVSLLAGGFGFQIGADNAFDLYFSEAQFPGATGFIRSASGHLTLGVVPVGFAAPWAATVASGNCTIGSSTTTNTAGHALALVAEIGSTVSGGTASLTGGAATTGIGGASACAGGAVTTGTGGAATNVGGAASGASGVGGAASCTGGASAGTSGVGGVGTVRGGDGGGAGGHGGDVVCRGGAGGSSGIGGNAKLLAGSCTSDTTVGVCRIGYVNAAGTEKVWVEFGETVGGTVTSRTIKHASAGSGSFPAGYTVFAEYTSSNATPQLMAKLVSNGLGGNAAVLRVTLVGTKSDGSAAAYYGATALYRCPTSSALWVLVGSIALDTPIVDSALAATALTIALGGSSSEIDISVTGIASTTIKWTLVAEWTTAQ